MNLNDLGIPSLEKLQAMSDKEIENYFSRYLEVCRPKEKPTGKSIDKRKVAIDPAAAAFGEMAKQFGVDVSKYL
jgi:hypothetical protein